MMEALSSSETLVLIRAALLNIPEDADAILHSHRLENLKSYKNIHVPTSLVPVAGFCFRGDEISDYKINFFRLILIYSAIDGTLT
jgi:hypothetical protein